MAFTTSSTFESIKIAFNANTNRITWRLLRVSMGIVHHRLLLEVVFSIRGYGLDRLIATEQATSWDFARDICECERFPKCK